MKDSFQYSVWLSEFSSLAFNGNFQYANKMLLKIYLGHVYPSETDVTKK